MEKMVNTFWKNKKVFLTGHTGFKGSWMSLCLLKAGAHVTGYSLGLPTKPSLFADLGLASQMSSVFGDIRDLENLKKIMLAAAPEFVIHMAAQPLVRYSYQEPVETYMTNVMGTVNLFEAVRSTPSVRVVVNVTSDKCYENKNRLEGYKEDEPMGGYDPYSSSKGCAELITSAYRRSFFQKENILVGSGRAGNVIGGGDWALDRIVPDIIRSVMKKETLEIRNPLATRPWQHVLEPVHGYLLLAQKMTEHGENYAEGFNFGPLSQDHCSVESLIQKMNHFWSNQIQYRIQSDVQQPHEAHYLSLDCTKAQKKLNWHPVWSVDQALQKTVEWTDCYLSGQSIAEKSLQQIDSYQESL